jgi:hypothetical protein
MRGLMSPANREAMEETTMGVGRTSVNGAADVVKAIKCMD